MDLASVVAALASVGVRVSGSNPNNNIQGDSSRACPTGLAGPEPSGTHIDPGQHFHIVAHGYMTANVEMKSKCRRMVFLQEASHILTILHKMVLQSYLVRNLSKSSHPFLSLTHAKIRVIRS